MREIKLRAWDEDDFVGFNYYTLEPFKEIYVIGKDIQLWTGLKDKNGKEIYEGDIVNDGSFPYEVWWEGEKPGFYLRNWHCSGMELNQPYIEVIGNIYEHPEWLKEDGQ